MLSARGAVREGSLASKLAILVPGETLYLDDPRDGSDARPLDRAIQSTVARSTAMKGRRFKTQGRVAEQMSPLCARRILAIKRLDRIDLTDGLAPARAD